MMRNNSTPSEDKPPEVGIVPTPTVLSGPLGVRDGPPDPQSFQKATRLLARLPPWRKGRRRLYQFGVLLTPISGILLWGYLTGPDWWQAPISGPMVMMLAYMLTFVFLWDVMTVRYKRAISVVLNAGAETSIGPIIDASCLLPVSYTQWAEVKRTLIDRLGRVTSPDDNSLTNVQLSVLHDIVLGRHLPTSFDTASHCIILNALVHMGDARTVACLEELSNGARNARDSDPVQAMARQYLVFYFRQMGRARSAGDVEKLIGGPGKTRDHDVVRETAQQCLVRLQTRLAAQRAFVQACCDPVNRPLYTVQPSCVPRRPNPTPPLRSNSFVRTRNPDRTSPYTASVVRCELDVFRDEIDEQHRIIQAVRVVLKSGFDHHDDGAAQLLVALLQDDGVLRIRNDLIGIRGEMNDRNVRVRERSKVVDGILRAGHRLRLGGKSVVLDQFLPVVRTAGAFPFAARPALEVTDRVVAVDHRDLRRVGCRHVDMTSPRSSPPEPASSIARRCASTLDR